MKFEINYYGVNNNLTSGIGLVGYGSGAQNQFCVDRCSFQNFNLETFY